MCPFLEAPEGLSPEILEMLDRAFTSAWNELQARQSPCTLPQNEEADAHCDRQVHDGAGSDRGS